MHTRNFVVLGCLLLFIRVDARGQFTASRQEEVQRTPQQQAEDRFREMLGILD